MSEEEEPTVFHAPTEFVDWNSMNVVYTGTVGVSNNKMEITLDTPYPFQGGDLIVGIKVSASGSLSPATTWLGESWSSDFGAVYSNCPNCSVTTSTFMPKTTFTYSPDCSMPMGLHVNYTLGDDTAVVTWNDHGYDYEIRMDPNLWETEAHSPFVIYDLDWFTQYTVLLRTDCGDDEYSLWNKMEFHTSPKPTFVGNGWSDDFEGTTCDWAFVNDYIVNDWVWGTAVNNGGTHAIYISNDSGATNAYNINNDEDDYEDHNLCAIRYLIFEDDGVYTFSYDWRCNGEVADVLKVGLVPDSEYLDPWGFDLYTQFMPTGWTPLSDGNLYNQTTWQTEEKTLQMTAGGYYLVFMWSQDYRHGHNPPAAVDNVSITRVSCPDVTDLDKSGVTSTGAILTWTAGDV